MNARVVSTSITGLVLRLQPFLTFAVFISVLTGTPPLWAAWLIALAPLIFRFLSTGKISTRSPFDIPIFIAVIAMITGFWHSPDRQLGMTALNSFMTCILLYYGIINNAHAARNYWILWCAFISSVVVFLTISLFRGGVDARHVVFNEWAYNFANSAHWPYPLNGSLNITGDTCAVIIPSLVSIALFPQKRFLRWISALFAIFFAFLLFLSAGGGGWIVLTIVLLALLSLYDFKVLLAALVPVTAGILALVSFRSTPWVSSVFKAVSIESRFEIWRATLAALRDSPFWGFGLGGWWSRVPSHITVNGNPHNAYLLLYSDTGFLGLAAACAGIFVILKMFREIWHSDRNNPSFGVALGAMAGIFAFGLHSLVEVNTSLPVSIGGKDVYFFIPFVWVWMAFLVVSVQKLRVAAAAREPLQSGFGSAAEKQR